MSAYVANGLLVLLGISAWLFQPLSPSGYLLMRFNPFQLFVPGLGTLALIWLIACRKDKTERWGDIKALILCFVGVGLILTSAIIHVFQPGRGVEEFLYLIRWCVPIWFFAMVIQLLRMGGGLRYTLYGLLGGMAFSVLCVAMERSGLHLPISTRNALSARAAGFFPHANHYGIAVSTTLALSAYFCLKSQRVGRDMAIYIGTLVVGVIALTQSLSKTNIAMAVVVIVMAFMLRGLRSIRSFIVSIGLAVGLAGIVCLIGALLFDSLYQIFPREVARIEDAFRDPFESSSMQSRYEVWRVAWEITVQESSLIGLGRENFDLTAYVGVPHAHNFALQFFGTGGVVALGGIVIICGVVLSRFCKRIVMWAGGARGDRDVLHICGGLACAAFILTNSMSASFDTSVMPFFCISSAFLLLRDPIYVSQEGDVGRCSIRSRVRTAPRFIR